MIDFRPFRNTDPPALAEVWRLQGAQRGLMQPMSMGVLERYVLSRPYFDRHGLIVAVDGGNVVGFVHAGFGPSADQSTLSTERGVICLLQLRPDAERAIAGELLTRGEAYLRERGSKVLYGGGNYPFSPFYYGLYGGSEMAGVPASDPATQALFCDSGYREVSRSLVLRRDLSQFRPVVDRQQMQIRRHNTFEVVSDPATTTWWEACMFEPFERTLCYLAPRQGGSPAARVHFWNMETMLGAWGVNAVGVVDLEVAAARQRQGLAKFLLGEAFRNLHAGGVAVAEARVVQQNVAAVAMFHSLGFEEVDQAVQYAKE